MADLLRKPQGTTGKVHSLTPPMPAGAMSVSGSTG